VEPEPANSPGDEKTTAIALALACVVPDARRYPRFSSETARQRRQPESLQAPQLARILKKQGSSTRVLVHRQAEEHTTRPSEEELCGVGIGDRGHQ